MYLLKFRRYGIAGSAEYQSFDTMDRVIRFLVDNGYASKSPEDGMVCDYIVYKQV
jgi:hypothetical protein